MSLDPLYPNNGQGAGGAYYPTSQWDRALHMNGGAGFAQPDAWLGPAPVYFTDPEYASKRSGTQYFMMGGGGPDSMVSGWNIPKGQYAVSLDVPPGAVRFWEFPIYRGPMLYDASNFDGGVAPLSATELEAKFGTADSNTANRNALAGFTPTPAAVFVAPETFPPVSMDDAPRFKPDPPQFDPSGVNLNRIPVDVPMAPTALKTQFIAPAATIGDPQILPPNVTTAARSTNSLTYILAALAALVGVMLWTRKKVTARP
jgi:hypothetical protein